MIPYAPPLNPLSHPEIPHIDFQSSTGKTRHHLASLYVYKPIIKGCLFQLLSHLRDMAVIFKVLPSNSFHRLICRPHPVIFFFQAKITQLNERSTLVLVMAWCNQATSHYLNQYWPKSISSYGIISPHLVDIYKSVFIRKRMPIVLKKW